MVFFVVELIPGIPESSFDRLSYCYVRAVVRTYCFLRWIYSDDTCQE